MSSSPFVRQEWCSWIPYISFITCIKEINFITSILNLLNKSLVCDLSLWGQFLLMTLVRESGGINLLSLWWSVLVGKLCFHSPARITNFYK
jgi:hypothetical protein